MAHVSKKIRSVKRPPNTKVRRLPNGAIGVFKIVPDKDDPKKVHLVLIGHIVNYEYIPIPEHHLVKNDDEPYMVSFALVVLIFAVGLEYLILLIRAFSLKMGRQIFIIAALKILYPNITEINMNGMYKSSYLSVALPKIPLSKNTVSNLYKNIGLNNDAREYFIQSLLSILSGSYIIYVDGCLKQYNSSSNSLSKVPYKKKYKGYSVVNVLTAYIKSEEILISEVYPGSYSDTSVYKKFLIDNLIHKGILVGDAAFVPGIVRELIKENPEFADLKYIGFLKSDDKKIREYNLLDFDGIFDSAKGPVLFKKVKDEETNLYYYAYKNLEISHRQENNLVKKYFSESQDNSKFKDEYTNKKEKFGVRIVESNIDLDVEDVYEIILERWCIETVFQKEKSHLDLNSTRVHSVYSVIGQEFINTISTILYQKICNKIKESGLIKNNTYKKIIDQLRNSWRRVDDYERSQVQENTSWILNEGKPTTDDGSWEFTTKKIFKILEILGICNPNPNNTETKKENKSNRNNSNNKSNNDQTRKKEKKSIYQKISEYITTTIQCINNIIDLFEKNFDKVINEPEKVIDNDVSKDNNSSDTKGIGRPQGSLNTKTVIRNKIIKSIFFAIKKLLKGLDFANNQLKELNDLFTAKVKHNNQLNKDHEDFNDQVHNEGLDPNSEEGKKRIAELKSQYESTQHQESEKKKQNRKQETLNLEEQVRNEGLDPASVEGKKRIKRLRRELRAAQSGKQLGKVGRPKSQETLNLEAQVRNEGLDPDSSEGKKRINCLRHELRTAELQNRVKDEGLDPESSEGKKRLSQLRRKQSKSQSGSQHEKVGRPKSQETLDLEAQVRNESLDPASVEGKKRINRLKRELKAAQSGKQLGKVGRPKSPETLDLEARVRNEGLDPASVEGKKRLSRLRRELRAA